MCVCSSIVFDIPTCYCIQTNLHVIVFKQTYMLLYTNNPTCYCIQTTLHVIVYKQTYMLLYTNKPTCYCIQTNLHVIVYKQKHVCKDYETSQAKHAFQHLK